jgi:hypothetical protein
MKPKRPTEQDLLSLVQNGFNTQLAKDREIQGTRPEPEAPPGEPIDLHVPEGAPSSPLVRMTLSVPEELRFRLKVLLMNQQRRTHHRMTQDEFCAIAIADLLDREEGGPDPWARFDLMTLFLQTCMDSQGLAPEWEAKAKALLQEFNAAPFTRATSPFAGRKLCSTPQPART